MPDSRISAEYRRVGVDHDMVFDCRMAFDVTQILSTFIFREAERAEGDSLIDLDMIPDDAGLSDDDSCSVVDKEVAAERRLGMNVDAVEAM